MKTVNGHYIRFLLTGELIDGFVQPNGGWRILWVENGQEPHDAIRQVVGDMRRLVRYETMSPCTGCFYRNDRGGCHQPKRAWDIAATGKSCYKQRDT